MGFLEAHEVCCCPHCQPPTIITLLESCRPLKNMLSCKSATVTAAWHMLCTLRCRNGACVDDIRGAVNCNPCMQSPGAGDSSQLNHTSCNSSQQKVPMEVQHHPGRIGSVRSRLELELLQHQLIEDKAGRAAPRQTSSRRPRVPALSLSLVSPALCLCPSILNDRSPQGDSAWHLLDVSLYSG